MPSSSTKPSILLVGSLRHAFKEWKSLNEYADLKVFCDESREVFYERCKTEFQNVKAILRTYNSKFFMGVFDEDVIQHLPSSVKYICHVGAGYETVNVDACSKRGIRVANCPVAVDDATADTAIFLMIGAFRRFNKGLFSLRDGHWSLNNQPSHDPEGKTLGILGMGGIGRTVAKRARAFDMNIIYYNRRPLSEKDAAGAKYVQFDQLLTESDVLYLSLPLNKHTYHIIGKDEFKKMKRGIVIVNTARGPVMDEEALVDALKEGIVYSAGLDVFEHEPQVHPGLIENPDVILLPHLGTNSLETQHKMEAFSIENMKSGVLHDKLISPVPEQREM
ncbi:hydroxyacid dehydrogenase [Schizosaccharomyces cryophilus OY26]|uniref:Hydroxyacid dehydrogenase n=1 Tax=Schizosaccharomyces cryophilus (strain OY26 / ATCC MYA-4695 / CBS 11777 / NBRC 106824 / NRRL Y48691) TaxID=653667 RepID=S9W415_SCHCR|nr:hydroxyacid dehydrogenase [Schizosaccharomyces cryophilus OY26]EPY53274.1 hydroxyacid dehydrogenase [Schizosaccharomyces cryophilus OY26]